MKRFTQSAISLTCIALTPAAALAHPGNDHWAHHHFAAGFLHPFTGIDHILAMVAVGMWAAHLGRKATWQVPAAFLAMMAAGGLIATSHVPLPYVESTLLASVLVMGLLLMFSLRLPLYGALTVAGVFAVFHGYAHVAEMPLDASGIVYGIGFLAASAALLSSGVLVGRFLTATHQRITLRTCGAVVTVGFLLLFLL